MQYKTTKKETFMLDPEDVERIEYNRPYWKKKEVKCELCNGTILKENDT